MIFRIYAAFGAALFLFGRIAWASPDPAADFLRVRAAQTLLPASQIASALQNPGLGTGKTLEATATVTGLISSGSDCTALLSLAGQSVTVSVPPALRDASWLASGAWVRVLLSPTESGSLRLLAAAPDGDVMQAERSDALVASRRASLPSRAFTESRFGRSSAPNAFTNTRADNFGGGHPLAALSPRALAIYGPYRMAIRGLNSALSEADVDKITTSILYFSDQNNMDPRLTVAMIIAESGFNLYSTSRTGAMGLGQLMPSTARGLGVTDAYDPVQNIGAAVHLLRGHLDKYGGAPADAGMIPFSQIALTMAAYNAGPGAVHKYHGVPPYRETQRYVARVAALYKRLCGGSAEASAHP